MEKGIKNENWILKDTKVIKLPHREKFVSFMKIKRKLYIN